MKWASFEKDGRRSYGPVSDDCIFDARERLGSDYPTLRAAIAGGVTYAQGEALLKQGKTRHRLSDVTLLLPVPDADKVVCAGRNYADHAAEADLDLPQYPSLFIRLLDSLAAHDSPLIQPRLSTHLDYECELAVIIGKPGRHIKPDNALDHVFGYTCFNDGSIRDFQFGQSLTAGKNFTATGGIGPWIVTADEIPDPSQLSIVSRLNGEEVQHASTAGMVFDVPTLISYISGFTNLEPGDIISTGTPEGVGFTRTPPLWLTPGDVVEVEISGIGTLRNDVAAET